jgi:hypothetical protein
VPAFGQEHGVHDSLGTEVEHQHGLGKLFDYRHTIHRGGQLEGTVLSLLLIPISFSLGLPRALPQKNQTLAGVTLAEGAGRNGVFVEL